MNETINISEVAGNADDYSAQLQHSKGFMPVRRKERKCKRGCRGGKSGKSRNKNVDVLVKNNLDKTNFRNSSTSTFAKNRLRNKVI